MTVQKLAYTFEEAAEQSGYSERTIRYQVKACNLVARYANSKGVIRHEDLAEWLDSLPAEPPGGRGSVSREPGATDLPWAKEDPGPAEDATTKPLTAPKALFRTPEQVAPDLGMSATALRRYCRVSGINTRLGKNRMMLHADDVERLVVWIRENPDKPSVWLTDPENDPFR
ncbi:hypothetical protein [Arthrobacter sp. 2MCAF14]|uniref:hypothetical protein n=1 Tax=Arthrobacter sp. 2MCAF14 TaxID=3232982 RepID=UPI003F8E5CFD